MLQNRMKTLPKILVDLIHCFQKVGDEKSLAVYIVGGFVRDLLLDVRNFDVDIVVEGDGIAFALECGRRLGLKVVVHKRFGTATLLGSPKGLDGFKVDVASARKEIYERPAALPTVSTGSIREDLFRRDFTINAMALCLNRGRYGELIDYYGGQKDLKKGLVVALHPESFIHDPTRILRAIRFEQRYHFRIERMTKDWIKNALKLQMLHAVGKHRIRDELILMFKEDEPLRVFRRLYDICGYDFIALGLTYQKEWQYLFGKVKRKIQWFKTELHTKRHLEPYVMFMAIFFYPLSLSVLRKTILQFAFHKSESSRILSLREHGAKIRRELIRESIRPSRIYQLLEPLSYEAILVLLSMYPEALLQKRVRDFLNFYNGERLHIRGEHLRRLGVPSGPSYKKILQKVFFDKIDGKVSTKDQELALVEKMLKSI